MLLMLRNIMLLVLFLDFVMESFRTELRHLGMVHGEWTTFSHAGRLCQYGKVERATKRDGIKGRLGGQP